MRFNGKTAIVTIDHVSPPSMDPIERYRLPREKWPSYSLPTVHANPGALMPQVSSQFAPGPGIARWPARPTANTPIKHAASRFSLAALAAVALYSAPAMAQYDFADHWRIEVSGAYTPRRASHVASEDGNFGLTTVSKSGNGVTANLRIWNGYVTTNLFCDVAVRCWYLDRVVSSSPQGLKAPETTLDPGCWC
jgi:hypothetical protein